MKSVVSRCIFSLVFAIPTVALVSAPLYAQELSSVKGGLSGALPTRVAPWSQARP